MGRHDNRDRSRNAHGGYDGLGKMGDDYIDIEPDQFGSKLLGAIAVARRYSGSRARYSGLPNSQGFANHVLRASANGCGGDAETNTPTSGNFRRCCARAASGHRDGRSAEKRDELAPSHSITSSARVIIYDWDSRGESFCGPRD